MTPFKLPPETAQVLGRLRDVLQARGVEAYLVGGLVRDALLGRPTADIDVALTAAAVHAEAEALAEALPGSVVPLDPSRRIYRVVPLEGDVYIDLTPLRGGSPEADAALRDFTIDALALRIADLGETAGGKGLLDSTGGLPDLEGRVVRAVSPAVFQDDPLRLLRGLRLAAEIGLTIEPWTLGLMRRDAPLLAGVAGERVRDELCRILAAPGAAASLRLLDSLGLLTTVIPELEESRGCAQSKEHYWDVLEHSIETVAAIQAVLREPGFTPPDVLAEVPWDDRLAAHFQERVGGGRSRAVMAKLAALLHDVSKPATKVVEADGRMRFHGHPVKGAGVAEAIMRRLRFTNRETRMVSVMVEEHLRPILISRDSGPSRRALHRFFQDAEDVILDTLYLSFADYLAARGPLLEPEDWGGYAAKIRHIMDAWRRVEAESPRSKLLDGHELMRELGLPAGPQLGRLLEAVREEHAAGTIATKEEALAFVRSALVEDRGST